MLIVFSEISVGETEDDYNVGKYDKLLSTFIPSFGNSNTISEFKMFSIETEEDQLKYWLTVCLYNSHI